MGIIFVSYQNGLRRMIGALRARETGAVRRVEKSAIFREKSNISFACVGGLEIIGIHFQKKCPNGWDLKKWCTFFSIF